MKRRSLIFISMALAISLAFPGAAMAAAVDGEINIPAETALLSEEEIQEDESSSAGEDILTDDEAAEAAQLSEEEVEEKESSSAGEDIQADEEAEDLSEDSPAVQDPETETGKETGEIAGDPVDEMTADDAAEAQDTAAPAEPEAADTAGGTSNLPEDSKGTEEDSVSPEDRENIGETILLEPDGEEAASTEAGMAVVKTGACGKDGDNLTYTIDEEGTLTISGTGEMADYEITDFSKGLCSSPWNQTGIVSCVIEEGVTTIGDNAFSLCRELTGITIPESVTHIGDSAFYYCYGLTGITIPESVTHIGDSAFFYCYGLTSITIPNSVTSIGDSMFAYCMNLTSITIPESITSIEDKAFLYCSRLTSITIPDDVTSIGRGSFAGCGGLTSITVPNSVTSIGDSAFSDCRSLTSIALSENVTSIGVEVFSNCSSLTSITIPDSVTNIGNGAFKDCSSLTSITIPDSVTNIGSSAFSSCRRLTSITIPESITSIGKLTFSDCSNLTSITIPNSVTKISDNAFVNCGKLTICGYRGSVAEDYANDQNIPFNALKTSIKDASITGIVSRTYTGKAQTQTPTVKVGGITLTKGTDYTLSYENNTNAGTAAITISGKGDYKDSVSKTFKINKASQSIVAKASASSVSVSEAVTVSVTGAKGTKSFKSSNTDIATVTKAGRVTAKKVGTVKITATSAATANYKTAAKTVTIKVVPAATASITAGNQANGIKLTWKKVTGATGFKVYRGSTLLKKITSGSTVTYTDTKATENGKKYTYKVVAFAGTGDSTLSKSLSTYWLAQPKISSLMNSSSKTMTAKWEKNSSATGYQIQYSLNSKFASGNNTVSVKGSDTVSKEISELTKNKTYYVRMRTYKTVGNTKYYSAWSAAKNVKIEK